MSMAARSSNLEDQRSGANLQTESHMAMESQCWKGPEEMGALGSSPSCLAILVPSQRAAAQLS